MADGSSRAPVTVSIPTRNRRDVLRTTLLQLIEEPASLVAGIVVADNASTDGTAHMIATDFPSVRCLRLPYNIGAEARNAIVWVVTSRCCDTADNEKRR